MLIGGNSGRNGARACDQIGGIAMYMYNYVSQEHITPYNFRRLCFSLGWAVLRS